MTKETDRPTHREGTSTYALYPVAATAADNFDKIPVSRKKLQPFITKTRRIKQCKELLMIILHHPEQYFQDVKNKQVHCLCRQTLNQATAVLYRVQQVTSVLYRVQQATAVLYRVQQVTPMLYRVQQVTSVLYRIQQATAVLYRVQQVTPMLYSVQQVTPMLYMAQQVTAG